MLRVLLADDHPLVRQGLKKILSEELGTVSYGEADDGTQVMERVGNEDWDILILDITMPGRSGFDIVAALKEERPDLPILVLSMHSEDQYAIRLMKAGAAGYLTKEKAPREVVAAVKKVLAGGKYISPSFAEKLVLDLATGNRESQHGTLSQREFQVLRMIASGNKLTEIGDALSLSVKTVSTYRARVLDKLKLRTNADLTEYALKHGII